MNLHGIVECLVCSKSCSTRRSPTFSSGLCMQLCRLQPNSERRLLLLSRYISAPCLIRHECLLPKDGKKAMELQFHQYWSHFLDRSKQAISISYNLIKHTNNLICFKFQKFISNKLIKRFRAVPYCCRLLCQLRICERYVFIVSYTF